MALLTGKKCLITGASRGIGRAVAILFARNGVDTLFIVGRDETQLQKVASECKAAGCKNVHEMLMDLSDVANAEALAMTLLSPAHNSYGVDIIVNNAGAVVEGTAVSGDIKAWGANINLNLYSPMILIRLLSPEMQKRKSGVIINMGSVAAIEGMTSLGLYSATKHGIRGWSLHCYQKLRYDNIKVMLINPGFVATDMALGRQGSAEGGLSERMIQPEDIAEVCTLPFKTSGGCCPEEINLRLTRSAYAN